MLNKVNVEEMKQLASAALDSASQKPAIVNKEALQKLSDRVVSHLNNKWVLTGKGPYFVKLAKGTKTMTVKIDPVTHVIGTSM